MGVYCVANYTNGLLIASLGSAKIHMLTHHTCALLRWFKVSCMHISTYFTYSRIMCYFSLYYG